ncbi:MAG: tetratricopeptide repeat protein [Anaerolineae bacterium]|nr:tetratricopeptide repeat protein [Anaerolineae bacterium]
MIPQRSVDDPVHPTAQKIERIWLKYLPILVLVILVLVGGVAAYVNGFFGQNVYTPPSDNPEALMQAAIAEFQRAIELEPNNVTAYRYLAQAYMLAGNPEKATDAYQQAATINPEAAWPRVELGKLYEERGEIGQAIIEFEQAVALEPDNADAYDHLSQAYLNQGKIDKAIAVYEQAVSLNADQAWPHLNLGEIYLAKGNIAKATAAYQNAAALSGDAITYLDIASSYRQYGHYEQALKYARLAATLAQDNEFVGRAYREQGLIYQVQQENEKAEEQFLKALRISPTTPPIQLSMADFYFWHDDNPEKAIAYYRRTAELAPDQSLAYLGLGRALLKTGSQEEALQVLKTASSADPTSGEIQQRIGELLLQYQLPDQAQPYLEQAIELDPKNAPAYLHLASLYRQDMDYPQALEYASQAIKFSNDKNVIGHAHLEQAIIYQNQGKDAEALEQFLLAVAATPTDAQIHAKIGDFYEGQQGQEDQAIEHYYQATRLDPNQPWYYIALGKVLFRANHQLEGMQALETALSLAQGESDVYLALGQMAQEQQDWPTQIEVYERALTHGVTDIKVYLQLGDAYRMIGANEQAMNIYRQAAQLEPDNPELQQRLGDNG